MSRPTRRVGGRSWGLGPALALAVVAPGPAQAQTDAEMLAALRACASVGVERARLACFDGVFAAEPKQGEAPRDRRAVDRSAPDAASVSPAATVAPATATAAPAPAAAAAAGAGARKVTIVEVHTLVRGKWVFVAADGREFVQTSTSSRVRLPDVPFDATLESGAFGSTFLAPEDGPRVRVSERG